MKKILLYLFTGVSCFAGPLTVGNIPQVFTPTSLTNSPISASGNNINVVGTVISGGLSFSGSLNGISAATVGFISNLSSDAQAQITANSGNVTTLTSGLVITSNRVETINNGLTTTSNSLVIVGNGLVTTSNRVETLNTAALAGLTTVSNGLTTTSNLLTTVSNGLVTTSNRVETINGLNVKLAGDTMTGPLKVTALTNSALTASQFVFSDLNKALISVAIGTGITNNGGTLSNNIVAGSNITITSGANGQLSIASTSGGSTPTGTGFTHITGGVQDGASKIVDVSSSDITGILAAARFPALTGDITTSSGAVATTLKNTGTAGTYTKPTFDAQGRETSGASAILASSDYVNQGTTTTLLHGNAAGNPSFGQVSLTADVTGVLPIANFTTGTPNGSKFVRDDGVLAVPAGSGGGTVGTIVNTGTSIIGNLARYTDTTGTNVAPTTIQTDGSGNVSLLNSLAMTNTTANNGAYYTNGILSIFKNGIGTTDTDALVITNGTAALTGAQQESGSITLYAQGFKTTATAGSQQVATRLNLLPIQGAANPSAAFTIGHSINGGAFGNQSKFNSDGSGQLGGANITWSANGIFNLALQLYSPSISLANSAYIHGTTTGVANINDNTDSAPGGLSFKRQVLPKTSNFSILSTQTGATFSNVGAAGLVNFTLPTAVVGFFYDFTITDAQTFTITAAASTTIRIAGSVSASAGNITASAIGNTIRLQATSTTTWVAMFHEGTWTVN